VAASVFSACKLQCIRPLKMKMAPSTANESDVDVGRKAAFKKKIREDGEVFDESFGYQRFCVSNGNKESRRGWIFNMISTVSIDAFSASLLC